MKKFCISINYIHLVLLLYNNEKDQPQLHENAMLNSRRGASVAELATSSLRSETSLSSARKLMQA